MIGRGWLVALTIFGAGMIENDAGLAAAVLVVVLFTVYFAASMAVRPFQTSPTERPALMRARVLALLTPLALVLLAPASAFALNINEDFKPQNEFKLDPWIEIHIGGIDLSINKAVLYLVLASGLTIVDDGLDRPADAARSRTGCRPRSRSPTT